MVPKGSPDSCDSIGLVAILLPRLDQKIETVACLNEAIVIEEKVVYQCTRSDQTPNVNLLVQ